MKTHWKTNETNESKAPGVLSGTAEPYKLPKIIENIKQNQYLHPKTNENLLKNQWICKNTNENLWKTNESAKIQMKT